MQLPDLRNLDVATVFRSLRLLDLAHNQIASMEMLTLPETLQWKKLENLEFKLLRFGRGCVCVCSFVLRREFEPQKKHV